MKDRILETTGGIASLDGTHITTGKQSSDALLSMWTIYEKPEDYPNQWVVRRGEVLPMRRAMPEYRQTGDMSLHDSLASARAAIPKGKTRVDRTPRDVLSLVESWV